MGGGIRPSDEDPRFLESEFTSNFYDLSSKIGELSRKEEEDEEGRKEGGTCQLHFVLLRS